MGNRSSSTNRPKVINYIGKGVKLGKNVKIWHFTYIGDRAKIGDNVTIGSLVHLDRDVTVGRGTRIEGSVYIPPGTVIGKNTLIGPGAIFTNDPYPPSRPLVGVTLGDGAIIGAGSVIRAGVKIGARAVVGMGAVVLHDVPPDTVVVGSPAKPLYSRKEYDAKMIRHSRRASSLR